MKCSSGRETIYNVDGRDGFQWSNLGRVCVNELQLLLRVAHVWTDRMLWLVAERAVLQSNIERFRVVIRGWFSCRSRPEHSVT